MKKNLSAEKRDAGFTLVELFVTVAIAAILSAIAIPGFSKWLPNYRLKSAARDLYSNLQLTKIGAVKTGSPWAIVFDTGITPGRYYVCSNPGGNGSWEGPAGDDTVEKTVNFANYQSGVDYGPGNATDDIPGGGAPPADNITYIIGVTSDVVMFSSRGTCNQGYVYLDNSRNNTSYGVGTRTVGSVFLKSGQEAVGSKSDSIRKGKEMKKVRNEGFTIIELLVAMTIGLVVMAGVSMTFLSQQRSYLVQEQVAAMQQNLRAAMYHMEREIRMAGCDPTFDASAQIVTANADAINFTMDVRGTTDGSPPDGTTTNLDENITYFHYDSDADGANDALGRTEGGGTPEVIASDIDMVDFLYVDQNDLTMNPAGGNILGPNIPNIKAVEITLIARTARPIRGWFDTANYSNQFPRVILGSPNDNFRRMVLTTRIKGRNL